MTARVSANISMLYSDLPMLERAAAAAAAGFSYVEVWWPFDSAAPMQAEIDAFCSSLEDAGVVLVALNLDAGTPHLGDRGLLSIPQHGQRIADNLDAALSILERTGCGVVNALYGNRVPGYTPEQQDLVAFERLVHVADRIGPTGASVVVETLNSIDSPDFPLIDIDHTAQLVNRANEASEFNNVGLLLDTYHLATMGIDPVEAVYRHAPLIRHVQFADAPGRGRPGTGSIDFAAVEAALADIDYDGFVGHEYNPAVGAATTQGVS